MAQSRRYETFFISDPDIGEEKRTQLFDRVKEIIEQKDGVIIDFQDWGVKKLAYEIKKKLRGHYVCLTYGGNGDLVKELERNFGLSDDVMKYMTILLSDNVTAETLAKEAVEMQEAKAARAQTAGDDTDEDAEETEDAKEADEDADDEDADEADE